MQGHAAHAESSDLAASKEQIIPPRINMPQVVFPVSWGAL